MGSVHALVAFQDTSYSALQVAGVMSTTFIPRYLAASSVVIYVNAPLPDQALVSALGPVSPSSCPSQPRIGSVELPSSQYRLTQSSYVACNCPSKIPRVGTITAETDKGCFFFRVISAPCATASSKLEPKKYCTTRPTYP